MPGGQPADHPASRREFGRYVLSTAAVSLVFSHLSGCGTDGGGAGTVDLSAAREAAAKKGGAGPMDSTGPMAGKIKTKKAR